MTRRTRIESGGSMLFRSLIAAALLVLLAVPLLAQGPGIQDYQELKFPPLRQLELPKVPATVLPNGMKLYLLEDHELPLVGGFAMVCTGNLFDPKDKIGLASLTGDVMRTGGIKDKTGDELDVLLENVAASVETAIGETSGTVGFGCLKENVDEVLGLFLQVLTAPEFRQEKLDLAKTQYRSMISRRNDDASGIASREFSEILYGRNTPYGWRMEYADLDNITRDDLVAFHRRYFFPANTILAIQGDFDAAEMKAKIERLFAGWTVRQPPVPAFPKVAAKPEHTLNLAVKEDVNQSFLRIGHLGGVLSDEDYPALEVMADILGGGFSSRLVKKIRTQLGYAYGIGSYWGAAYDHPGLFTISGSTKSESTTETIQAALAEVDRMRSEEVTAKELKTAKDKVLNSFVFNFDSPGKTLRRIVRYEYFGYPKDFIFKYQKAVGKVSAADVLRVAKARIKPEEFTFVVAGNPAKFGEPLTALNMEVHKIDLTIPQPVQETARANDASLAKGKAILAKLQVAVGGAEKLAKVKSFTRVTVVNVQSPKGKMTVNQVNQWLAPSTFRQEQVLPFGKMTAFYDGQTGWLSAQGQTRPMPPPVIRQVKGGLLRNPMRLWLADRQEGWKVNAISDTELEITAGDGQTVRLTVDPKTGLPATVTYQSVALAGAPAKITETLSDWREVDGIKLPFKSVSTRDGAPYAELTVKEMTLNPGLTAEQLSAKP